MNWANRHKEKWNTGATKERNERSKKLITLRNVGFKGRYGDPMTNRMDRLIYLCKGEKKWLHKYRIRSDSRVSSVAIKLEKESTLVKYNKNWMASFMQNDGTFNPALAIDEVVKVIDLAEIDFRNKRRRKCKVSQD